MPELVENSLCPGSGDVMVYYTNLGVIRCSCGIISRIMLEPDRDCVVLESRDVIVALPELVEIPLSQSHNNKVLPIPT